MLRLFLLANCVVSAVSMEGFIVGGEYAVIQDFPHSVFAYINCEEIDISNSYICGASIINQQILLSAAHCIHGCLPNSTIGLYVGTATPGLNPNRHSYLFMEHEEYHPKSFANDIMLIVMDKPFELNQRARRVALMDRPPYREPAVVAGWGVIDEEKGVESNKLKSVAQRVLHMKNCMKILRMPRGTICASAKLDEGYASVGDSGSALVVRGYIQIGIVSYKIPILSKKVVVYTDVGYFFNWIKMNTRKIFCIG